MRVHPPSSCSRCLRSRFDTSSSLDYLTEVGTETFAESLTYFPAVKEYRVGPINTWS